MVAQDIFGAMKKQGWHSAKLVDATGEPLNEANAPATEFEKEATKEINSGKTYFDRVVGEGNDRRLLAATVVPVVMKRCAECHLTRRLARSWASSGMTFPSSDLLKVGCWPGHFTEVRKPGWVWIAASGKSSARLIDGA